ncbi:sodium/hydrogen exchanger 8-like isoform X2 [Pocillopora damicornis]|uniref:sodium/hydrogen exchanger 8-like isoform X2 n=1 Tax=Pocillopora damicornis TaxID=46731 RepID=UPI000F54E5D1|nr:sodium/hydrogen exchanger 8-like isoform X2 [Pocillopora damicornis]
MMKSPLRKAVIVVLVVYASVSWCEDIPSETPSRTNSSIGMNNTEGEVNATKTTPVTTTQPPTTTEAPIEEIPEPPEVEQHSSMTIFFILLVVGALVGLVIKALSHFALGDWRKEEHFNPTAFFLILLPPIIFESGYSLHKGNFFANIGSIIVFAIFGTAVSAIVIGGGIYLLGKGGVAFQLDLRESFAFGSLISAVDPVATLAIFHALDVDPTLNMLVFGESILNDAVSIVMTNTILEMGAAQYADSSSFETFFSAVGNFLVMFCGSAGIGILFALISAFLLKHVDLRTTPSLELGTMLIFSYAPYGLAEGLKLSGIMAILFCGIVMSHYTHFNLSPMTQITVQQIFRTTAFMAETCVFAYLGMAIFSFKHQFRPAFVIWTIILCLLGRAVNIYPLSSLVNQFRDIRISRKTQFIMWFSGLRGAVAFALVLHLQLDDEKRHVLITSTLIIIMFTILCLGGSTLPLLKLLKADQGLEKSLTLSKTQTEGKAVDADQLTDDEWRISSRKALKGFSRLDAKYFIPFFTRKFTRQEVRNAHEEMQRLTSQLYSEVHSDLASEDEAENKL